MLHKYTKRMCIAGQTISQKSIGLYQYEGEGGILEMHQNIVHLVTGLH